MEELPLKNRAINLRKMGKTFNEIIKELGVSIPKSTLSYWFKNIKLDISYYQKIKELNLINISKARKSSIIAKEQIRKNKLIKLEEEFKSLSINFQNKNIAKIILSMLYLCEGAKTQKGSLTFGNSDPYIISLFLHLLRYCYKIDESKFRCTIQCRADQNIKELEIFWSKITSIPFSQFYKTRIDSRSIGKKTIKILYKGVCRIDYFSAHLFFELNNLPKIIYQGS